MSWKNEPHRHALASRGIRTRAIKNPLARPDLYDPGLYEKNWKSKRLFKGSGLENIDEWDVVNAVDEFLYEFDGTKEWEEGRLEDYYYMFKDRFVDFDMSFEDFEKIYEEGGKFFDVMVIYIFGSRVTGYWTPESDIDVFIELKSTPGIEDDYLDYMADKFRDTVENYMHDEGEWPSLNVEGRIIKIDIPLVTVFPPGEHFQSLEYDVPMILIWEAEN